MRVSKMATGSWSRIMVANEAVAVEQRIRSQSESFSQALALSPAVENLRRQGLGRRPAPRHYCTMMDVRHQTPFGWVLGGSTPTERRLLTCLVRNAGQVVAREQLLKTISAENIGTLRSYISRLRNKIEIGPALPKVIITHHKLGYSFAGKEGARWFPEAEPS